MMEIQPIVCSHCSAGVSDPMTIKQHPVIGVYFVCEFCGIMNVVGMSQTKREIVESITKKPITVEPTLDEIERFDFGAMKPSPSEPFIVTSWLDTDGKYDHVDSLSKPVCIVDMNGWYRPKLVKDGTSIVRIDKDAKRFCQAIVGLLRDAGRFKTVVINEWNSVLASISTYIRSLVGGRELVFSDWQMRNDVVDWILGKLHAITENGVTVHVFHDSRHEMLVKTGIRPDSKPGDDISHQLAYSATEIDVMEHGRKMVMMSVSHKVELLYPSSPDHPLDSDPT